VLPLSLNAGLATARKAVAARRFPDAVRIPSHGLGIANRDCWTARGRILAVLSYEWHAMAAAADIAVNAAAPIATRLAPVPVQPTPASAPAVHRTRRSRAHAPGVPPDHRSNERCAQRWISCKEPNTPLWVGSLLAALTSPTIMARVNAYADFMEADARQVSSRQEKWNA
jgi:hypothetical protein